MLIFALFACSESPFLPLSLCDEERRTPIANADDRFGLSPNEAVSILADHDFNVQLTGTGSPVDASVVVEDTWSLTLEGIDAEIVEVNGDWPDTAAQCKVGQRMDISGALVLRSTLGIDAIGTATLTMWDPDVSAAWLGGQTEPAALSGLPSEYAAIAAAHECHQTNSPINRLQFSSSGVGGTFDDARTLGAEPHFAVDTGCGEAFLQGYGTL